jgi:hypothetical protein
MGDKLEAMRAKLDSSSLGPKAWEASIYWMKRDGIRIMVESQGATPEEAVNNLYVGYLSLQTEGWKRT